MDEMATDTISQRAIIDLHGQVSASDYPLWILRHAQKLGLRDLHLEQNAHFVRVWATGPQEMLDALLLGCSLGPESVLVEHVDMNLASEQTELAHE